MNNFVIPPAEVIALPIHDSDEVFPVRRIYCVGKNYKKHVAEMGGDPNTSTPVFFTKSRETIVLDGSDISYPSQTENLHFEVELVVAMKTATDVFGYGVGIDMTRRDVQAKAKQKGGPWDMAKNFNNSAPCSALVPIEDVGNLSTAAITLTKNEEIMQNSTLEKMIYSVNDIIFHLSQSVSLAAGDLIMTGTPEGVGPVSKGDTITGSVSGLASVTVHYV